MLRRTVKIKTAEIRKSFIEYFKSKDHKEYSSSPVIPFDDPTLMFTNAGMNQFKDIFIGKRTAEYPRAVTVQKCMRAGGKHNDLENVGRTGRHHTFFEMLGNFSFGDYFKEEAIYYGWEWVTKYLELPKDKLYATVYNEDDEAYTLWGKIAPELKNGRILRFDKKENYWSMGEVGPNGPCSEIHFDRGKKFGVGPEHTINGESDRFIEIWNLVFMQFNNRRDGTTEPLPRPSVDTGAGLERIACIMQGVDSNYETDIFRGLIEHITEITGKNYHTDERGVSHRVIADHVRALTFCIADGGGLSNEKQGYVLRRILRRAARHGRLLDMHEPFIYKVVPTLVSFMSDVYPDIRERQKHIQNVIRSEEESFGRTLDTGLELFDNLVKKIKHADKMTIPGEEVFKLYDTYGFPVDLTRLMAEEQALTLDMEGFDKMMRIQRERSRAETTFDDIAGLAHTEFMERFLKRGGWAISDTKMVRDKDKVKTKVERIATIPGAGAEAVVLEETPFYVEAGGQVGDTGYIRGQGTVIRIHEVLRYWGTVVHIGTLQQGNRDRLSDLVHNEVSVVVDTVRRWDIMRNHTATHLLHAALRDVLGKHVHQSGSYVGPDKLRFDFSHFKAMTPEEISDVVKIVNDKILASTPVATVEDDLENAKKSGAMAIFGEKYESKVRVVSIGDFSKELCGGTHVENTSQIGPFIITLETAVAAGVRRIEAVTGREAVQLMLKQKNTLEGIGSIVNRPIEEVTDAVNELHKKFLELQKENKKLKAERFSGGSVSIGDEEIIDGVHLRTNDFGEVRPEEMEAWVDSGKGLKFPAVTCAVTSGVEIPTFMCSASGSVDLDIGKLSRELLQEMGGKGGGKRNFARGTFPQNVTSKEVFDRFKEKIKSIKKKG